MGGAGSERTTGVVDVVMHVLTRRDKYSTVAKVLEGRHGSLLDVGARDRILGSMLDTQTIQYVSAEAGPGHDYHIDLEEALPLPDRGFDVVVALDVLEHVEHAHRAFHELARLTRQDLIIGLPNIGSLPRRWSFLWHGHFGTQKYDLLPEHQGDRHRWLTIYRQINTFIEHNAAAAGFTLVHTIEQLEGGPVLSRLAQYGMMPRGLMTGRCIYVMTRGGRRDRESHAEP